MSPLGPQTVPDTSEPHLCLWNTSTFYGLRDAGSERVAFDQHTADGRHVGTFVAGWDDGELVAGYSAPFGGPDFVRDYETIENVVSLVRTSLEGAASRGAVRLRIRLKPPHYAETEGHLLFTLLTTGFVADRVDLNYFIDLRPFASGADYETALKPQSRRTIRHARDAGVSSELVANEDTSAWRAGYDVLEHNRVSKGRPMRLPFEYITRLRDAFPDIVRLLVSRAADGTVCAAALVYRVSPGHDVVQYWGDAFHALPHSPMPVLARDVVEHSLATGGRFLDLGISTDHGVPNHGLVQFKRSIGAQAEIRLEVVCDVATALSHPGWDLVRG